MHTQGIRFSILRHSAWIPGLTSGEPGVKMMPPMLRRRASFLGKMGLEVAYDCLDGDSDIPVVFCSRHGEVARATALLSDLARGEPLSPMTFGMAVHNATPGLFSIARNDHANYTALSSGAASVEHAVIEACGQLADGASKVLLINCDCPLPEPFTAFEECEGQPINHAWAWLMVPAAENAIHLRWEPSSALPETAMPGGLEVAAFYTSGASQLERFDGRLRWIWSRDA